ncbi:TonB-dependent receptor [Chitinophaga sp. CB10]|uniref:SusC/RagA family TonB-linked outer membrane protein n=1 Tax=Chitinophaga sp. CB10 TaxID=1891659 RepID=UPI0025C211C6|nr:TonB-dependent receptor [Chitinophaga sp. CB10]
MIRTLCKNAYVLLLLWPWLSSAGPRSATRHEAVTGFPSPGKKITGLPERLNEKVFVNKEIKGLVTDSSGTPLPGVTVVVKNKTSMGTVTDINGRYILVVPENSTVIFSMMGFEAREVAVTSQSTINMVLKPATNTLGETVVVAYGTQKKREVVGSVTSINVADLKVPSSNLTTALAGRAAGLIAYQRSGEPGADNADFFVRGVTTFGYKKDPLILIDGVELSTDDLARLRPDDIESFSIMKDATSTALYGARGANGVILVTTRHGKEGPAKINFRAENSFSQATKNLELADPVTYMQLANEATKTRNPKQSEPYTEDQIRGTKEGKDPLRYPANDWQDRLFKKWATNQRANLNVSGGGSVARYFVSGSFTNDNGVLKVDKQNNFNSNVSIKRYTIRANVDVDLTKSTLLTVRTSGNFDDYKGPIGSGATTGGSWIYRQVMHSNPVMFPAFYPKDAEHSYVNHIMFGNNLDKGYLLLNPYAALMMGYKDESRSFMSAQMEVKQKLDQLIPGLNFRTMVNVNRTSNFYVYRAYAPFYYQATGWNDSEKPYTLVPLNPTTGREYLDFNNSQDDMKKVNAVFYWESSLSYAHSFGKHNINGMLINIMRSTANPSGETLMATLPGRNTGLSGRATYNYDTRYFAEFNFGYNGSERFYEKKRFGFFPSAGVAWTISNENFFKKGAIANTITNLKLRSTYGLVGNDAIGNEGERFFYLSDTRPNDAAKGAVFGTDRLYGLSGYTVARYANPEITWEKSYQANAAIELSIKDKLNFTGEVYKYRRTNILMAREFIPSTMGLTNIPKANVGEAESKGVDLSLDYNQHYEKSWFQVMANFTYATGIYTKYEEPQYMANEAYRSRVGRPISGKYGLIAERLFVDDKEALNSPRQTLKNGEYKGGDIKYTDLNGDGLITDADMTNIGFPETPEIVYGFGFSAGYKNWDISAFFQGVGRTSFFINADSTAPFVNETQLLKAYADDHWSEENQNVYALWPRLSNTYMSNNSAASTWWMRNGAFLRLKQVEIGYNLPKTWQKRLHTSTFRLYVNATNLFCLSKFDLWDVEMGGQGLKYPVQRVFNFGVNLTFN